MDQIKVGLDFGTHQTKICVQRTPDEGHGQPIYEFFKFKDLNGNKQYVLPSVIQINKDNTLSYGYVDISIMKSREKERPTLKESIIFNDFDINVKAKELYNKYATESNTIEDMQILKDVLEKQKERLREEYEKRLNQENIKLEKELQEYEADSNLFRHFKQATFTDRTWTGKISCKLLSIWYLSYVIFNLEEIYTNGFDINMGIPTDDENFEAKKKNAVEIILSAYNLVEEIYKHNKKAFLAEKVNILKEKTIIIPYSLKKKKDNFINIFPEAYASLISLTSKGKIPTGMNLTVDIGGGTTDISFFTIQNNKPMIYKYWSLPRGLNYIAEESGFDYSEKEFITYTKPEIVERFNNKKREIVWILIKNLNKQFKRETKWSSSELYAALKHRILVYSGGGSAFQFLTKSIDDFDDVMFANENIWKEENVRNKNEISSLCQILTTAYGLSIAKEDKDVILCNFETLFSGFDSNEDKDERYIDKDQC